MNREIKFRCWIPSANFMGVPFDPFDFDPSIGGFPSDAIFTQFTGLKDKEGTEIYDQDIIQDDEATYQVYWCDDAGAWDLLRFQDGSNMIGFGCYTRSIVADIIGDSALIGNIFEHRHLLEK